MLRILSKQLSRGFLLKDGGKSFFSSQSKNRRHVIAALVVNEPGCLAEIANLFAARGYNIDSLVVGRTEVPELSRMSVVVNGSDASVNNMKKQLEDVVHVAVVDILTRGDNATPDQSFVEKDLMLAKVSTVVPGSRTEVIELSSLFHAKIIDVQPDQVMIQLAGTPNRIEAFIELLKPIGIVEIHRSGVIAMSRGEHVSEGLGEISLQGATQSIIEDSHDVDATALPPG